MYKQTLVQSPKEIPLTCPRAQPGSRTTSFPNNWSGAICCLSKWMPSSGEGTNLVCWGAARKWDSSAGARIAAGARAASCPGGTRPDMILSPPAPASLPPLLNEISCEVCASVWGKPTSFLLPLCPCSYPLSLPVLTYSTVHVGGKK